MRRWLRGAQGRDGGFVAWIDEHDRPAFVYPEISGYALTFLSFLRDPTRDEVDAAERCSEFLRSRIEHGQLEARHFEPGVVYAFDLGMIASGLFNAADRFGLPGEQEAATLVDLIASELLTSGRLAPVSAVGAASRRRPTWSTSGELHLAKVVQALLLGAEHGVRGADVAAERLIERTTLVLNAHRWPPCTSRATDRCDLHPLLYCAEGLWIWSRAQGDERAAALATRVVQSAVALGLPGGALPGAVDGGSVASVQGDVLAQGLRLVRLLGMTDALDLMAQVLAFAETMPAGTAVRYTLDPGHDNTWATLFAAQALELESGDALSWRLLV